MGKRNTEDLEARAREQFAEELRGYGHGFAFSDVPAFIVVPRRKVKGKHLPAQCLSVDGWRDSSRWAQVREELEAGMRDRVMVPEIPKGWSFGGIVKDAKPHRFDLRNPRIYSLDGTLIPWDNVPGEVSGYSAAHFEDRLLNVFLEAKPNDQAAEVAAFLEHHRTKGGNAEAFMDHVDGMVRRWKQAPPMLMDRYRLKHLPVERHEVLTRAMECWLKEAHKAPTSAKPSGKAMGKVTRPDLKLYALVHALRYRTNDASADITEENEQERAVLAGSTKKSAGRELRGHFTRYSMGADQHAQRLDDGRAHTVKRRYLSAIKMLANHPDAMAMAERELKELSERE